MFKPILILAVLLVSAPALADEPSTQPIAESSKQSTTPKKLIGEWYHGTVSPTTYWDTQTGVYKGNAYGMSSTMRFYENGTYENFVYIESRMYNVTTQIWTSIKGDVEFTDKTFTLQPSSGHYKTGGSSSRQVDRPMTEDELKEKKATYNWHMDKDEYDKTMHFIVPFDDGSRFNYRPVKAETEEAKDAEPKAAQEKDTTPKKKSEKKSKKDKKKSTENEGA